MRAKKDLMTMCEPKISVIIPTYNKWEYLPQAMDSLLEQTIRNLVCTNTQQDQTIRDLVSENFLQRDTITLLQNQLENIRGNRFYRLFCGVYKWVIILKAALMRKRK